MKNTSLYYIALLAPLNGARKLFSNLYSSFLVSHVSLFILSYFAFSLFVACDSYDSFTTDRSAVLTFSSDTIRFDTTLTTVPSSTKTLIVYNRGDKGLRISDVRLEGGTDSPFRVNVDGVDLTLTSANAASDFEVRRRDSIIVRTEVTLPSLNQDEPFKVKDALLFTLESGIQLKVPIEVVGQDAWFLSATTIKSDTTLTSARPYVVYDSLVVAESSCLTLSEGTQLLFHEGAGLVVRGRLIANGTIQHPVVFRGDRTDHIFDYLPYDRLPARWQGVTFSSTSHDNELNYLDLHSGRYGIVCDSSSIQDSKLLLTNCRIHNLGGDGIQVRHCKVNIQNTEISNTLGHCVNLLGGDATFTHCTLAQFYALDAARGSALYIANKDGETYIPLYNGSFINCVITGYADDVVNGAWVDGQDNEANYLFQNCFIATPIPADDQAFIECVYDAPDNEFSHEKNFQLIDTHSFLYDFTPLQTSGICGIAEPSYSQALPIDRWGNSRMADGKPDAGCYEFVER